MRTRNHVLAAAGCFALVAGCSATAAPNAADDDVGATSSSIIKGDLTSPEESGTVLIFSNNEGCSGTLLTNAWVLTAAHCGLNIASPAQVSVQMGSQSSAGAYAVNHPSLDFALVRLATPFHMRGSVTGYHVPLYTGSTASLNGQRLLCRGYGCNVYNSTANQEDCSGFGTLRQAFVNVKPNAFDDYNFTIGVNARGQVLAPGDSGTGCFASTPQGWALAGINKAGSTTENYLGKPENWRDWAMAYVNDSAVPLPQNWFVYTLPHPTFLKSPLSNDDTDAYTWNPCPGGHDYTFAPTYSLEAGKDFITVTSGGASVSLTGMGTITSTGNGPITVSIATDHQNQSQGLLAMPIQCSDLGQTPTFWHAMATTSLKALAAGPNPDGTVEAFGLDQGGQLVHSFPIVAGAKTTGWQDIPSHDLQSLVVGRNADGRLEAFAVGGDGALYHVWKHADGSFSGWDNLGRNDVREVAVTNDSAGTLHAFVLTTAGAVFRTSQTGPNGGWTYQWEAHGGHSLTHITAGQNADGRPELFAVGGDRALYQFWQWGGGTWSSWSSLGRTDVLQVAVANEANGTLAAYVRSSDGSVYRTAQVGPNGGWSGAWTPLWGSGLRDIAVAQTHDGRVQVFSVGGDAKAYVTEEGAPNGTFQAWRSLGGGGFTKIVPVESATQERTFGLETGGMVSNMAM